MKLLIYGDIGGSGGYVRYCKGLFASGNVPEDFQAYFISASKFCAQIEPLDGNVRVIHDPTPSCGSRLRRYIWHLFTYPHIVRKIRPEIEFYPSGQLRVFMREARTVATCHNLLLFDAREMARFKDGQERRDFDVYRGRQTDSMLTATGVIFPSEHSRKTVLNALPRIKLHKVVAHGLDSAFLFAEPRSYRLGNPVNLLYVSGIHYYKHHPEVIRAVKIARKACGLDVRLRIVGGGSSRARIELQETLLEENAEAFVELVGEVDRDTLMREYHQADAFIFASTSETFGIALLEAMGTRLPIACSHRSGLPDLLRDGGIYFDPEDIASIAASLCDLLTSEMRRQSLGEIAYQHAQEFTWERCARDTFDFIRHVATI